MRKILIFLVWIALLPGCTDKLEVTYQYQMSFDNNFITIFSPASETHRFTVSFQKEMYVDGTSIKKWLPVAVSGLGVKVTDPDLFQISNQTVSGENLIFDLTIQENLNPWERTTTLIFTDEGEEIDYYYLEQKASDVRVEYRFKSEANPFIIPVEGGEFTLGFTIESRQIINDTPQEWLYTDNYGLRYASFCQTAASHHSLEVVKTDIGRYYFRIKAQPYYLDSGEQFRWRYYLYQNEYDSYRMEQVFLHDQDPSLVEKGEAPATGYQQLSGYFSDSWVD